MAKLKAHGIEIMRITLKKELNPEFMSDREEVVYSFRSDYAILIKRKVHLMPGAGDPEGRWHDWGWKRWKTLKRETPEGITVDIGGVASRWYDTWKAKGLDATIELGGVK